jgi:hypothetical protein
MSIFLLAVLAILAVDPSDTPERRAESVAYLQTLQTPDGGFIARRPPPGEKEPLASLRITRTTLRAFRFLGGSPKDVATVREFVKNCYDPKSGGFSDRPGQPPDPVSTAVGLMALEVLEMPTEPYLDGATAFLGKNTKRFEDIRMAAAGLEAVGKMVPESREWLKVIDAARNPDGSYGKGAERARATALNVVAQLRLGAKPESVPTVLEILREGQLDDGGFGSEGGGGYGREALGGGQAAQSGSDLESCYRIMRAFSKLKAQPDRPDELRKFIARCRNADGGYGVRPGAPSTAQGTYYAAVVRNFLAEAADSQFGNGQSNRSSR